MHPLDSLFTLFKPLLTGKKNIIIQMHINPDGDAIGSSLGLSRYLAKLGYKNTVVSPNMFPSFLKWMNGSKEILTATEHPFKVKRLYENADLIFVLDFNAPHRAGEAIGAFLTSAEAPVVMIDHHVQPEPFAKLSISTHDVSSTSELIYHLIEANNDLALLDKELAESLYVGIMTDTGSFSYSCNTPSTYRVVADLVAQGIHVENIHQLVYNTYSEKRLRLLGYCLNDKLKVLPEFGTSYMSLSKEELKNFNHKIGDTEGVVNFGLSIDVVAFTALFTEREGRVRISFRSKGTFDVNVFARTHFSGGGHKNASGADSPDNMEITIQKFEALLPLYKDQIKASL